MPESTMPKRNEAAQNRGNVKQRNSDLPTRKSLRLQQKAGLAVKEEEPAAHPPSPESTAHESRRNFRKRGFEVEEISSIVRAGAHKRRKASASAKSNQLPDHTDGNPIEHWVLNDYKWPEKYIEQGRQMDSNKSSKKSSKRRGSSSHGTDLLDRMETHNIYFNGLRSMRKESHTLCDDLMKGNRSPPGYPMYAEKNLQDVVRLMSRASEALIQKYLTPIIIPAILPLQLCGRIELEHFGDEMKSLWNKAETMGPSQPKPDYVAGLRMSAFDTMTQDKLNNYATPATPVLLTSRICFPLVIGEVVSPEVGILEGEVQALHAAAIALKSIVALHWAAYGKTHAMVKKLYGQALVFTICHNHSDVHVSAHYTVLEEGSIDKLQFYRQKLALWSLDLNGGRDRHKPYNFVENVYRVCGPLHLKRIRDAAQRLPAPAPKTSSSLDASQMPLDTNNSQETRQAEQKIEDHTLAQELSALRALLEQQREESKTQLEQAREDSRKREEESRKREEQAKEESKALRLQLEKLTELLTKQKLG